MVSLGAVLILLAVLGIGRLVVLGFKALRESLAAPREAAAVAQTARPLS